MKYELQTATYTGPLQKLLELVEEKKLEITAVSLAEVTADFLNYLKKLEESSIDHFFIADFLIIASKLILIKSKVLLPTLPLNEEEELDIRDLEIRLKIYQELKKTNNFLRERWSEKPQMAGREVFMSMEPIFYPPKGIEVKELYHMFYKVIESFQKTLLPVQTIKREIINLKSKIEEVLQRITDKPLSFKSLKKSGSRTELIVLFLAILHLIKDQFVLVNQENNFHEITIAKKQ